MPNGDSNTDSLLRGKRPANTRTINSEPCDKIDYDIWKHLHAHIFLQGGEASLDPLSCRSFSTKEPLNIGHVCGK